MRPSSYSLLIVCVIILASLVFVSATSGDRLRARMQHGGRHHARHNNQTQSAVPVDAPSNYKWWGFDYAYGNGVTAQQLKDAGCAFVCRYLSGGSSKDIDKLELDNLSNAGIKVVLNWETTGQENNRQQGIDDAKAAEAEASRLGKGNAPLYFSADFDPSGREAEICDYMRGVASVIGHDRTGLYGGYAAVKAYFDAGIGKYAWQTYAWSGGAWDGRAQLEQYENGAHCGPATVDRDRATSDDYGQCN